MMNVGPASNQIPGLKRMSWKAFIEGKHGVAGLHVDSGFAELINNVLPYLGQNATATVVSGGRAIEFAGIQGMGKRTVNVPAAFEGGLVTRALEGGIAGLSEQPYALTSQVRMLDPDSGKIGNPMSRWTAAGIVGRKYTEGIQTFYGLDRRLHSDVVNEFFSFLTGVAGQTVQGDPRAKDRLGKLPPIIAQARIRGQMGPDAAPIKGLKPVSMAAYYRTELAMVMDPRTGKPLIDKYSGFTDFFTDPKTGKKRNQFDPMAPAGAYGEYIQTLEDAGIKVGGINPADIYRGYVGPSGGAMLPFGNFSENRRRLDQRLNVFPLMQQGVQGSSMQTGFQRKSAQFAGNLMGTAANFDAAVVRAVALDPEVITKMGLDLGSGYVTPGMRNLLEAKMPHGASKLGPGQAFITPLDKSVVSQVTDMTAISPVTGKPMNIGAGYLASGSLGSAKRDPGATVRTVFETLLSNISDPHFLRYGLSNPNAGTKATIQESRFIQRHSRNLARRVASTLGISHAAVRTSKGKFRINWGEVELTEEQLVKKVAGAFSTGDKPGSMTQAIQTWQSKMSGYGLAADNVDPLGISTQVSAGGHTFSAMLEVAPASRIAHKARGFAGTPQMSPTDLFVMSMGGPKAKALAQKMSKSRVHGPQSQILSFIQSLSDPAQNGLSMPVLKPEQLKSLQSIRGGTRYFLDSKVTGEMADSAIGTLLDPNMVASGGGLAPLAGGSSITVQMGQDTHARLTHIPFFSAESDPAIRLSRMKNKHQGSIAGRLTKLKEQARIEYLEHLRLHGLGDLGGSQAQLDKLGRTVQSLMNYAVSKESSGLGFMKSKIAGLQKFTGSLVIRDMEDAVFGVSHGTFKRMSKMGLLDEAGNVLEMRNPLTSPVAFLGGRVQAVEGLGRSSVAMSRATALMFGGDADRDIVTMLLGKTESMRESIGGLRAEQAAAGIWDTPPPGVKITEDMSGAAKIRAAAGHAAEFSANWAKLTPEEKAFQLMNVKASTPHSYGLSMQLLEGLHAHAGEMGGRFGADRTMKTAMGIQIFNQMLGVSKSKGGATELISDAVSSMQQGKAMSAATWAGMLDEAGGIYGSEYLRGDSQVTEDILSAWNKAGVNRKGALKPDPITKGKFRFDWSKTADLESYQGALRNVFEQANLMEMGSAGYAQEAVEQAMTAGGTTSSAAKFVSVESGVGGANIPGFTPARSAGAAGAASANEGIKAAGFQPGLADKVRGGIEAVESFFVGDRPGWQKASAITGIGILGAAVLKGTFMPSYGPSAPPPGTGGSGPSQLRVISPTPTPVAQRRTAAIDDSLITRRGLFARMRDSVVAIKPTDSQLEGGYMPFVEPAMGQVQPNVHISDAVQSGVGMPAMTGQINMDAPMEPLPLGNEPRGMASHRTNVEAPRPMMQPMLPSPAPMMNIMATDHERPFADGLGFSRLGGLAMGGASISIVPGTSHMSDALSAADSRYSSYGI